MNGRTERWVLLKIKENFEKKGREKLKKSKSRAFATRAKKFVKEVIELNKL